MLLRFRDIINLLHTLLAFPDMASQGVGLCVVGPGCIVGLVMVLSLLF